MDLPILSASRLKDARACQRLHRYRYVDGYRLVREDEAIRFGSLTHGWLEAWWLTSTARLEAALAFISAPVDRDGKPLEADPFDRARAEAMAIGYDARWADEPLSVIAVESEFRAALVNPESGAPSRTWQLGGKLDAIAKTEDGRTFIIEHKTTSEDVSPGSEYWRRLRMDGQVSIYFEGARALGHAVDGCLYDVLKKPALRPLKATPLEARKYTKAGALYATQRENDETPDEFRARCAEAIAENPAAYFQRGEVVRHEAELAEARFDIWQLGKQLREAELAGRWPRNPDACVRYGKTCPFFGVCTGETSLDDPERFIRSEHVHPELAIVAGP